MWGHNVNELQKLQTFEGKCECYFMGGWQLKKVHRKKKGGKNAKNNSEARLGLCWFTDDRLWHHFSVPFLSSHSFLHAFYHNKNTTVSLRAWEKSCPSKINYSITRFSQQMGLVSLDWASPPKSHWKETKINPRDTKHDHKERRNDHWDAKWQQRDTQTPAAPLQRDTKWPRRHKMMTKTLPVNQKWSQRDKWDCSVATKLQRNTKQLQGLNLFIRLDIKSLSFLHV